MNGGALTTHAVADVAVQMTSGILLHAHTAQPPRGVAPSRSATAGCAAAARAEGGRMRCQASARARKHRI